MVQKRDSPSMEGRGGMEEVVEVGDGATIGSVGWGVEGELDGGEGEVSTTSSDSRLMGSPIVVFFASLERDGFSLF